MDKLPRPGYRIEGIPAEITRGQISNRRAATEDSSTVVPFSQENFIAPNPPESGIDLDSQKETQKNVVPPIADHSETSTEQTARTLNEIKLRLLEFFDTLEAHDRQEISQHEPQAEHKYLEIPNTVWSIAKFLKECALTVKDFELAGMAGFVQEKAEQIIDHYYEGDSNEDSTGGFEQYQEQEKKILEARDFRSAGWFEYSHTELQTLETLGYMKDVPYGDWMSGGVPTEKAVGLFKYSEDHRRIYWSKEMRKRIDAEVGPGGLAQLHREAIKRKEDADWEQSEWVACMHLGKRLDQPLSATLVNKALEGAGYQVKIDRGWWATEKAEGLCHQEGLRAGTARILWKKEMLDLIKEYLASKKS